MTNKVIVTNSKTAPTKLWVLAGVAALIVGVVSAFAGLLVPEWAFLITPLVGIVLGTVAMLVFKKGLKRPSPNTAARIMTLALVAVVVGLQVFGAVVPAFAQATPTIDIPTDVIFSETNFWIDVFAPIAAIGIGIGIAIAVLGYIGNIIRNAFR